MAPEALNPRVLIVDDEPDMVQITQYALRRSGITNVVTCLDGREVPRLLDAEHFAVITLDLSMPSVPGIEVLDEIVRRSPETPVIIVTASGDAESAVECLKRGAYDFLVKPVESTRLMSAIRNALEQSSIRAENLSLKRRLLSTSLERPPAFAGILTCSRAMESLFQYAEVIAPTPLPVLITGETGVGKELLARSIHHASGRTGAFVALNLAGLDDAMFSDTLFGHTKGAFTGAQQERPGLLQRAESGTIFLDEIGDVSQESQTKLLRLLQEREYYRLGDDTPRYTSARFVCATNRNLEQMTGSGTFRSDLYFRLVSHTIDLPPLRERREDIPLLARHFAQQAATMMGKPVPSVTQEFLTLLEQLPLSGNIRELEGIMYDAVLRAGNGDLTLESALSGRRLSASASGGERPTLQTSLGSTGASGLEELMRSLGSLPTLEESERLFTREALRRAGGNQGVAAKVLGISRTALNKRIHRRED